MSWQLGSLVLLALGLGAGFAWYERSRPDARVVACVGTMAAFAALGRIAFAAVPNVKPTGDIVLIAGFALGGSPGYVVGAVAALTSNFFFGQGPWTPWQMAGWGLTGIAGAVLARATGGRIGRWPLASICFVLGFAFTALQDTGDWFNYSDHSLAQLGVYVGKGVGFDLIYACACFAFALAFGPALVRALQRFRLRLDVRWLPQAGSLVALLALVLCVPLAGAGVARASTERATPLTYLRRAQNRDGGFGPAPGQASTPLYTGWVVMASVGGPRALRYLAATVREDTDPGSLERTILAVCIAHRSPASFGGVDLVALLRRQIARDGAVSDQSNLTAFAILALRAAGAAPPPRMLSWLAAQQDADGGFNYATRGSISDVDDTGAVLQALAHTGRPHLIERAVAFIRRQQDRDGGFPGYASGPSNAQSTAFAVQGLLAAGFNPDKERSATGMTPFEYLKSLIQRNGAVNYAQSNSQTPVWVTAQAELALSRRVL